MCNMVREKTGNKEKTMDAATVRALLEAEADPEKAIQMKRFFKTGPGEYGEGDSFWGLSTPQIRKIVKTARQLPLVEIERLLEDPVHEVRACGLLILVDRFGKGSEQERETLVALYLQRTDRINNWDLVDISASIIGVWLKDKKRDLLYRLADSSNLWEQRIAVVSTLALIKNDDFTDILALADKLRTHRHDLMHKALGWMLREVGKRDKAVLEHFLERSVSDLPRTLLRYAIERFPEPERKAWLKREYRKPARAHRGKALRVPRAD